MKTFYIRKKAREAHDVAQPGRKAMFFLVLLLVSELFLWFLASPAYERIYKYDTGMKSIRNGDIMNGRALLWDVGSYRGADQYLENNLAEHARQLYRDGQFFDGYSLMRSTELDQELVIKNAILARTVISEEDAQNKAKQLLSLMKEYDVNKYMIYDGFIQLEQLYLRTHLLDVDKTFLSAAYKRQQNQIWQWQKSGSVNQDDLYHCERMLVKLGSMVDEKLWNSYRKLHEEMVSRETVAVADKKVTVKQTADKKPEAQETSLVNPKLVSDVEIRPHLKTARYPLNLPWPQKTKDNHIRILLSPKRKHLYDEIWRMFETSVNRKGYYRYTLQSNRSYQDNAQSALDYLGETAKFVAGKQQNADALVIVSDGNEDYTDVLLLANLKGIAVWVIDGYSEDMIWEDVQKLVPEAVASHKELTKPTPAPKPEATLKPVSSVRPTPTPTPETIYPEAIAGYELRHSWTQEDKPVLHVLFNRDVWENGYSHAALWSTLERLYGKEYSGWDVDVVETAEEAERKIQVACWRGRVPGSEKPDGILIFPDPEIDYTPMIDIASEAKIPVWVFTSDKARAVEKELMGLYTAHGKKIKEVQEEEKGQEKEKTANRYSMELSWPKEKTAQIRVIYSGETHKKAERLALQKAFAQIQGKDYFPYESIWASNHLESEAMLRNLVRYETKIDGILVFPYHTADYSEMLEEAREKGIPVWVFSDHAEETVMKELAELYR